MSEAIIKVNKISKKYSIGGKRRKDTLRDSIMEAVSNSSAPVLQEHEFWALKDISFEVKQGEILGIIGRNGAGKSTLLKILSRITAPTSGRAEISGRLTSLLEIGTGFHPELTGRENVFLNGAILGMDRKTIARKFDEIVGFSEIENFLDTPVKYYSSGMYTRLAFAVAANLDSEILVVDEVLATGDVVFQKKSLEKMEQVAKDGRTVLVVSHSVATIQRLCNSVMLLDGGKVVTIGNPDFVIETYLERGLSSQAKIEWKSKNSAPGDNYARLKSVRILNKSGQVSGKINITDPFSIEIQYWVMRGDYRPTAGFYLRTQEGIHLLSSFDFQHSVYGGKQRIPGVYNSVCKIPGNFLAPGFYSITPIINYYFPVSGCNVECPKALSFEIVDNDDPKTAHRYVHTGWPGIIRPKLDWDINRV